MTRSQKHDDGASLTALISVHDVMPETRAQVEGILQRLASVPPAAVALLVVPGRAWTAGDLNWLRALSAGGYTMVGHGWRHKCDTPQTFKHRLHSWLISNRAAEHLSHSEDGIKRLMCDCHAWMEEEGLAPSTVYVPPAWAIGRIAPKSLRCTPFRFVETLHGLYDIDSGKWRRLPVVGFEVDRAWRRILMTYVNALNTSIALKLRSPLRIAIHPWDWQLALADQLSTILDRVDGYWSYGQLVSAQRLEKSTTSY